MYSAKLDQNLSSLRIQAEEKPPPERGINFDESAFETCIDDAIHYQRELARRRDV
jgi:hypothetical protein